MRAAPVDTEEETGASGVAYGEFGPIELDPQAKQTLEQVLGTGGSTFAVSVLLKSPKSKLALAALADPDDVVVEDDEEARAIDGRMFVNQHMIKIQLKDGKDSSPPQEEKKAGKSLKSAKSPRKDPSKSSLVKQKKSPRGRESPTGKEEDVISLKYTIDFPKVELHPFDTRKFSLYYADNKVDAKYDLNKCIEMRAATRQARDIITLLIRCFSAQTYFINSKIIANVCEEDTELGTDENAALGPKIYSVSDVLCELDQVKRELYNQIRVVKSLESDKVSLSSQIALVEEEMQVTIESYKSVIEATESDVDGDSGRAKTELQ